MKLAKKVLSVVLALAIALGAFAVVGSAAGNPDGDYQVKVWLTGAVGSATWTTNAKVTIDEGDESDAGAEIEVQPGDTVFVRFYITNNYYVSQFQAQVYYSADPLDAAEIYKAQRNRDITAANLKKIHIWNEDNYWAALQGTSYSAQNPWSMLDAGVQANVEQNWPTDDEGNALLDINDWKFARFNNLATEGVGETSVFDDDSTHLFMMPLTIPETAKAGDKFYVTVPEGSEQREAKPYGPLRLYENGIADGEDEPCDVVDTQAQLNPNFKYGSDNQYWDLSEATLTLVVPGASEPEVDYTALNTALADAAEALKGNITDDSKAALNAAITAGTEALASDDQAVVDAAVAQLTKAIADAENLADYTALNAAIARYEALNPADWSNFATATAKYDAAKAIATGLGVSAQATINAAAAALNDAIDNLKAALDYSALIAKYNELAGKDVANYTDTTVARFNTALAAAKALIDNQNAADQNAINATLAELVAADAALALKDADYSALNAAKAAFTALNANDWTPASYAAAQAKYDAACAVAAGLKITDQATIDAAAAALNAAIAELAPAGAADYTALNTAIAAAKALVAENYVDFSGVAAALAAAEAVDKNLNANDQNLIDAAAKDLNDAMAALDEADADYTAANAAKAAAKAKIAEKSGNALTYTDAYITAVEAAINDIPAGLKKKDQADLDAAVAALNNAVAAVEYRAFDYSAINAKIAEIEAIDADNYNADSYAAYLAAKAELVWDYTNEQFGAAMAMQSKFLRVAVELADAADYTGVDAAIAAFEAKIAAADYEQAGIDAVNAIIDAIDWTLNENHQDEVDAYAAAIIDATAALVEIVVEPADYTALEAAIAAAKALDSSKYVSFGAVIDALYDAQNIPSDLTADDQNRIDAATKALNDAMAALKEKADYSALIAARAEAAAVNANLWTADSYKAVTDAVAAAANISTLLSKDDQAIIDAAAKAITDAIAALEAKEVTSSITEIAYEKSEDTHNTFAVKVEGRPAMIQFIEMDNGTRTYDRYNKNVTIVSYNAAGEVVNSLDRSVAYEVWTINTNLIGPDVKVRAKYLAGRSYIWETETYNFTLELVVPTYDAELRDIIAATSGKKGAIATTVVVGPDAEGIKFVMENGTTTTYSADKATVLGNGDLEFTGKAWANNDGLNTIVIKVKVNGAWVEKGAFSYTVE